MSHWAKAPMDRKQVLLFFPTLDDSISEDHPVRLYDEILAGCDWSSWESQYVLVAGQPPIPPRVVASAILYGFSQGIRSSRALERMCKNSLDYIWLVHGHRIDHTTFCKFRTRFARELKELFRQIGRIALNMGFACLDTVGLDGSRVRANSSRHQTASAETLQKRLEELDRRIEQIMAEAAEADAQEGRLFGDISANKLPSELASLSKRQEKLRKAMVAVEKKQSADKTSPALPGRDGASKSPNSKEPKVPVADPDSDVLPNKEGGYAPNYTTIAATETRNGFIVDAEVISGGDEGGQTVESVDRIEENFDETPRQLLADTNFGSGENLAELQERKVEAYIPVRRNADCKDNPAQRTDPTQAVAEQDWPKLPRNVRTKKLDRSAFVYDQSADCYYCPMGNKLQFAGMQTKPRKNGPAEYRIYRGQGCSDCALSGECLTGRAVRRTICRDKYEPLREKMDARMNSPTGQKIYQQRKWLAETPFAIIKARMGLRQFLLRGIEKVRTEWLWACTGFNLAKLARCIARLRVQTVAAAA